MKRWEEVETEAEEEKGLLKRQFHVHINTKATANDDIQGNVILKEQQVQQFLLFPFFFWTQAKIQTVYLQHLSND